MSSIESNPTGMSIYCSCIKEEEKQQSLALRSLHWVSLVGNSYFPLRGVWWWRHQALFVLLKLKGPCKVFGPPYPLSLWPHHAQTWRTSHQSKGWDLWQLGKKPPFPRRQMCDVSQCLWTSWSLELLTGERCFSEVAARGARAVKETEYATSTETNESVPFSGDRRYHTKSSDWKWKYMITNHMARR